MSTAKNLFRSSVARTAFMAANIVVAFFMMPFLVGKLGDYWYGIWTLLSGLAGYYYLIDLGLSSAVTVYFSKHVARGEFDEANAVVNTSLLIYALLTIPIFALTGLIALLAGHFMPAGHNLQVIRAAIFIIGLTLALEFPFKAFAGIISAYVRYDLQTLCHFTALLLGAALTVFFINKGYGILALSIIGFATSQVSNLIYFLIARHLFKPLRFGGFRRKKIRELFSYSMWSFFIDVSNNVKYKLDNFVVAWGMNASLVTHYYIGARLPEYVLNLIMRATNMSMPVFSRYKALSDEDGIRSKLLFFTKINTVLAVFGGGLLIVLGRPLIARWMGPAYLDAYPVLIILTSVAVMRSLSLPVTNVLYAISKHRYLAIVDGVEGVLNLVLSLALIRPFGLIGVALGTLIPLAATRLIILPFYTCKHTGLALSRYYQNLSGTVLYTSCYLVLFFMVARNLLLVPDYKSLVLSGISSVPLYAVTILFISFNKSERALIWGMLARQNKRREA